MCGFQQLCFQTNRPMNDASNNSDARSDLLQLFWLKASLDH